MDFRTNSFNLFYPSHYGLTGRIIKNLKMPKKLRQGAQNSGKIARKLELIKFSASD